MNLRQIICHSCIKGIDNYIVCTIYSKIDKLLLLDNEINDNYYTKERCKIHIYR